MTPTTALLWAIWRQHRRTIAAIALLTIVGRIVDYIEGTSPTGDTSSPVTILFAVMSFLLLFGVMNFSEGSGSRGLGRFPRRLFTLPVGAMHLVAVPTIAGMASIELLYLLWLDPLSRDGVLSVPFVALLLAALVVFYLSTLWTLERAGTLRLLMMGGIAIMLFAVGQLPTVAPTPPPIWRSEIVVGTAVAGLAVVAFIMAWRHVSRVRDGDERTAFRVESIFAALADIAPARRRPFASPHAAQFWLEWRASGLILPIIVSVLLLIVVLPASWRARDDANATTLLLLAALAAPIVLAIPVGIAFSKPTFWSEELGVPAFLAVRPLASSAIIAVKISVAAASTVGSWLLILGFATIWLILWGNPDALSLLALQVWAFHGHSTAAVYGTAVSVVLAGMFLTWRFLVIRLWSGMIGQRYFLLMSIVSIAILIVAGLAVDVSDAVAWLLADTRRLAPLVWAAAAVVVAKFWIAAFAWRNEPARYLRVYMLIWFAGTASFLALGLIVSGMVRIYMPIDGARLQSLVVLLALLAMPLARVGLAPSSLARNRHRS